MSKSFTFALNSKPRIIAFMLFLQFFILFSSTQNLQSVEIINYKNPYSDITGIYDSQDYGLVFSNSTGIFSIDKSTGELKSFEFENNLSYFGFDNFFEFNGELYFYRTQADLFVYRGRKAISIASNVVAHYCKDDKIYIIKSREPRLQVLAGGTIRNFYLNDTKGMHSTAYYFEYNNEIYGYVRLDWTGNIFVFKMTDSGPEFLMAPNISGHNTISDKMPIRMRIVNGEMWFSSFYGNFKVIDDLLIPWDNDFSFSNSRVRDFEYDNGVLYVLTSDRFIRTNLSNKEENILFQIEEQKKFYFIRGEDLFYLIVGNLIYTYNPDTAKLAEFPLMDSLYFNFIKEDMDNKLFVVKNYKIEWYNKNPPTVFYNNLNHTNRYYGLEFDNRKNRLITIGQIRDELILQTFDGTFWDYVQIPYRFNTYDQIANNAKVRVDNRGNYLVTVYDFMGVFDGKEWETFSLIKNPEMQEGKYREYYDVMLRDSLGGLWVSALLDTFSYAHNKNIISNSIWRYFNGEWQKIADNLPAESIYSKQSGICMRDNSVFIDFRDKYLYKFENYQMTKILVEDGLGFDYVNEGRSLGLSADNKLILNFGASSVWRAGYGSIYYPGTISEYHNGNWEHTKYKNIAINNDLDIYYSHSLFDTYGNNWILTYDKFLRINPNNTYSVFDVEDFVGVSPYFTYCVQYGNSIWFNSPDKGLYEVNLPAPLSVTKPDLISNYIINPVVTGSHLELTEEVRSYSIFSLTGQEVARGSHASIIDVELLSSGIYFIKAETYEETFINKFQIAR